MSRILAISGWKQSGKDTIADYLMSEKNFKRKAFADKLKDMVSEEYSIPRVQLDHPDFKEKPILSLPVDPKDKFTETIVDLMEREFRTHDGLVIDTFNIKEGNAYWTPRALCILKGSVNRAVSSNFWVQSVIKDIKSNKKTDFVITDLRYKSEIVQLREAFGDDLVTVRINRFSDCPSTDASERDLDNEKFDYVIENKKNLKELYNKVEDLLNDISKKS